MRTPKIQKLVKFVVSFSRMGERCIARMTVKFGIQGRTTVHCRAKFLFGEGSGSLNFFYKIRNRSVFSGRSLFAVARPFVVCRLSVTLVHQTQAVQIFGSISTALGTLAIR